jgi:hypothetical protein
LMLDIALNLCLQLSISLRVTYPHCFCPNLKPISSGKPYSLGQDSSRKSRLENLVSERLISVQSQISQNV